MVEALQMEQLAVSEVEFVIHVSPSFLLSLQHTRVRSSPSPTQGYFYILYPKSP